MFDRIQFVHLALAATLASALPAQATGRTITTIAPANLGATAQFAASYPTSAAGNLGWYVMAGHQVGTVPVPIPGFTVNGSCRVNPAVLFQTFLFFMDGSGSSALSLSVPNSIALVGFPFDLQTLDADLTANNLSWSDNDTEIVVGPATRVPLPSANMVLIPAGTFAMGSNAGWVIEQPIHQVTISRPFWMGKYEVTQAEYQAVMGRNPSHFAGLNRPVEEVNYHQATYYCVLLTSAESAAGRLPVGYEYRLPTEAEWEYCCRAGTTTEWNTGTQILSPASQSTQIYYLGANVANAQGSTTNVGTFAPNAFGLCDMHGNVAEWCLDSCQNNNINQYGVSSTDPLGRIGEWAMLRGGSFALDATYSRSACRRANPPGGFDYETGFRVVLAPSLGLPLVPQSNFVGIPAGSFAMGSTVGNTEEQPMHPVTFMRPFWMSKFEVTQAEYQAVMGINPSFHQGAGYPSSANRPVEQVSWLDAKSYCAALTMAERNANRLFITYEYRLPTEAEWEYCCRAGTTTEWSTGSSLTALQANYLGSALGQTSIVGSYSANPFGLFDMHGNVQEWCLDYWDGSNNYPISGVYDPYVEYIPNCNLRIVRGGHWSVAPGNCRSARRDGGYLLGAWNFCGFRVVCAPVLP